MNGPFANPVGFLSIIRREMVRTYKIINQAIWPPIITTVLYVLVFGMALGSRIHSVGGVSYAAFLIPGLIMLQIIEQTYSECSSSLFQNRFMGAIQELLVAPLSAAEIVAAFIVSAVLRALFIAGLVLAVGALMVHTLPTNWPLFLGVTMLVAVLFGAIGFIFGLTADRYDNIAAFSTFIMTPLVFVGGVFTPMRLLPAPIQRISVINPMFSMIDALRASFTGHSDLPLPITLGVIGILAIISTAIAYRLTAIGYKLRV
ncbi:MAG TPA: ABC transporter permease [Candidatus Baltobacteraceae bacterium]|jgi:ABC-2 type transport system permease protein|nr:ABC transporter permease [Candidatus Baltobacteraceae bacterium]